jgi:enamine deaminase RidA (YjgF/YER057c/UK114 family)
MIYQQRLLIAGREHLFVSVASSPGGSEEAQSERAIRDGLALIEAEGFRTAHLVRSRLFAQDAHLRRVASDLRVATLTGDLRSASSSYIDPRRLPSDSIMAIELLALRAAPGASKTAREYDPPIAPPMFVALDGMIYLSGVTDVSASFQTQVANIGASIGRNLAAAGASAGDVVAVSAYASSRIEADDAWGAVAGLFPGRPEGFSLSSVEGYSAPQKLLEVETTARRPG